MLNSIISLNSSQDNELGQQPIGSNYLRSVFSEKNIQIEKVSIPGLAKIFFTYEKEANFENYAYSGIRVLSPMSDEEAISNAKRLSLTSSSWKNWLINHAIKQGALNLISLGNRNKLPWVISQAKKRAIYGGRIIIVPECSKHKGEFIEIILKNSMHSYFHEISKPIYQAIGDYLNQLGGKLKATPDFGPNASTADLLHAYTEHALGISFQNNGSGGKSEYSITSIITALNLMNISRAPRNVPITLIGSAGALGLGVADFLAKQGFKNVAICDLVYDEDIAAYEKARSFPSTWKILSAKKHSFTNDCLARSGKGAWIITTAYGDEMLNSNWRLMKPGTIWVGAQNKDLPEGMNGVLFARKLARYGILHLPGQVLTIGGTVASWIEWHARKEKNSFSKEAAHEVVSAITHNLVEYMIKENIVKKINFYESMLNYAAKKHWQESI